MDYIVLGLEGYAQGGGQTLVSWLKLDIYVAGFITCM